ncbi:MAG: aspartate--tRNA ligase [Candidatus Doudnabacteria bacterium]|nr:aspartate--tRNA ligase [Candidatus Doudnabacteria bacterium]
MKRTLIQETVNKVGEEVLIKGWVNIRRDHGKLIFLDIRDRTGLIQVVVNPKVSEEAHKVAAEVRNEYVVELTGKVNERPEKLINPNLETGKVELEVTNLTVLSKAKPLPFDVNGDTKEINEETRMKYRYLDLRSDRMTKNLRLRDQVTTLVREYMHKNDFVEIETPMLTKSSPEGARDFLVPSRLQPGNFYALPQAPQQYKQLLMIAGLERYFQLARAMRDEDLRGDRQLEHTQIDLEMSFVKERDVLDLVEGLMIYVAESCGKKVLKKPFPVYTHEEAVKQFGADKFDLRGEDKDPNVMAFAWVVDFPLLEWDEDEKRWTFAHNPFSAPKAEHVEKLMKGEDLGNLRAQQYDLVCNGYELASGGVRISDPAVQRKVFELMGLSAEQTEERFGHLINAYEYGAPPHAGMAPGLDRLIMLLANEENIREVNAFPVNSSGQTSVMEAPSPATDKQLKELHIKIDLPKSKDKK